MIFSAWVGKSSGMIKMKNKDIKIITIEEAFDQITGIVNKAENDFLNVNSRFPDLLSEEDYILLGDHLDVIKEVEIRNHSIIGQDIAFNLIKNYLDRKGFFDFAGENKSKVINGMLGRLQYNPSFREYEFRIDNLNDLIKNKVEFPHNIEELSKVFKDISKICFLKSFEASHVGSLGNGKRIPNKKDQTGEKYKRGFERLGTEFVNPSAYYGGLIKWKNYQEVIKKWEPCTHFPFKEGRHNSFYR